MEQIIDKKYQEKICKIVWIKGNIVAFDFDGFGISAYITKDLANSKEIRVKYKGKIGSPDFEFKI